ncbi:hypothetical protein QIS74_09183 [Colletotrichum tabaci]|uniref:BZIP domain-containing protein n=1 Tax=Colletotrichum tabaci TaxID=1209068 RepID=A0AAV9T4G1_9PEZI
MTELVEEQFRNERCEYLARPHQTKRSLQAELERMKDAQHRRDTILGALAEPGQSQDVLRRLCGGETFETIYESLDAHDLVSPAPTKTPDAQSQPQSVKAEEASWTPNQTPLCSPPILDYSYSHGSEASHVRSANSQHAVPAESMGGGGSDGSSPHFNVFMPNNMALPDHMNEYGVMDDNNSNRAMMSYGGFMDCNAWIFNPNASYTDQPYTAAAAAADGNVMDLYPWQTGIPTPTLPTNDDDAPPVTDHSGWPFPPFVVPQIPSPGQAGFLQPLTPSSPKNRSFLASPATSREQTNSSQGSSVASVGESRYPTPPPPPPPKRRKYVTQANNKPASSALPVTVAVASTDCKTVESAPADEKKAHVQSPEGQTPPHDRERHRRASARNWQKQKQQSAELEAAMRVAEDRNRMLHREFAEIASQVMDAKNALIAHAQCNHPAINSWLRCHATDYVLNKGAAADRRRNEPTG